MPQPFLQSAAARGLSVRQITKLSDDEAYALFRTIRFCDNQGEPQCPWCGCGVAYTISAKRKTKHGDKLRPIYKCAHCLRQFSLTSGTIFAHRKLAYVDMLLAIKLMSDGAKGKSSLELSRNLDVQHKTAWVLAHKLREVMGTAIHADLLATPLHGKVEVDGTHFGGKPRPRNHRHLARSEKEKADAAAKAQTVVVMRERGGRTVPFVRKEENEGVPLARQHIHPSATVYTDAAAWWNALAADFADLRQVNHNKQYWTPEASTNHVEGFHARTKRSENGVHHRVAGRHLHAYMNEGAWRENHRRSSNLAQFLSLAASATRHPVSREWKGTWQRQATPEARTARERLRRRGRRIRH